MDGLSTYYNLSECIERDLVFDKLDKFVQENKISWNIEELDIIKIVDIDLDEIEIETIKGIFYKYDVIPDVCKSPDDEYYNPRDMYDAGFGDEYDDFGFDDDEN